MTVQLHSVSMPRTAPNIRLQRLAMRTFIGSCCTLVSSVTYVVPLQFARSTSWGSTLTDNDVSGEEQ